jgi:hypothetical protein
MQRQFEFVQMYWGFPALISVVWLGMLLRQRRASFRLLAYSFLFSLFSVFLGAWISLETGPRALDAAGHPTGPVHNKGFDLLMNGFAGMFWCIPLAVLALILAPVPQLKKRTRQDASP